MEKKKKLKLIGDGGMNISCDSSLLQIRYSPAKQVIEPRPFMVRTSIRFMFWI